MKQAAELVDELGPRGEPQKLVFVSPAAKREFQESMGADIDPDAEYFIGIEVDGQRPIVEYKRHRIQ